MVFYFTLPSDPSVLCYMGRDKYENEDLIKYGWPEDIWFHVDSHSSAHVYVRMPAGKGMDDLSEKMIEECCQLTKQNSIEGCKLNHVKVVYTPWSNLKKTGDMAVGQVSFHQSALRRFHTVEKKDTLILKQIEKTRVEKNDVNFCALRAERDSKVQREERERAVAKAEQDRLDQERKREEEALRSYAGVMDVAMPPNNKSYVPDEDDFM